MTYTHSSDIHPVTIATGAPEMFIDPPMVPEVNPPEPVKVGVTKETKINWQAVTNASIAAILAPRAGPSSLVAEDVQVRVDQTMALVLGTTSYAQNLDGESEFVEVDPEDTSCLSNLMLCEDTGEEGVNLFVSATSEHPLHTLSPYS